MRAPVKGQRLESANGDVWIVARCYAVKGQAGFFAVDLIKQSEVKSTSGTVTLTAEEFAVFCHKHGVNHPHS